MAINNSDTKLKTEPQIWIDVTHLISWHKSFTGIQRTQFMYSKFGVEKFNAKLFKIDFKTQSIKIVELSELLQSNKTLKYLLSKVIYKLKLIFIRLLNLNKNDKIMFPFKKNDLVLSLGVFWVEPSINTIIKDLIVENIKITTLIFDIIPILRPEFFTKALQINFKLSLKNMIQNSNSIISISKNTETDLLNFCQKEGIVPPKIKVIRLGEDLLSEIDSKPLAQLNKKKFILYVSTIEPRKNHERLLNVWGKILVKYPDHNLVLFGKPGWLSPLIISKIESLNKKSQLIWVKNGTDDQLKWLYENCLFTIYPSLYEGWGLPVAESLALNKHCLCSNSSSLPEIYGNCISYFNPHDELEMENKILDLIGKSINKKLPELDYKITTWEDSSEKLFDCLI
jgi:hypothetical protein